MHREAIVGSLAFGSLSKVVARVERLNIRTANGGCVTNVHDMWSNCIFVLEQKCQAMSQKHCATVDVLLHYNVMEGDERHGEQVCDMSAQVCVASTGHKGLIEPSLLVASWRYSTKTNHLEKSAPCN